LNLSVEVNPNQRPSLLLKMRALFAVNDAYVFTTWSGGVPIDEFIKISQKGFEKGVKIAVSIFLFFFFSFDRNETVKINRNADLRRKIS
jgi:hypothetical protein